MKILWVCNIMLPAVARYLNREVSNREGWLTGLAEALLEQESGMELALAFPVEAESDGQKWMVPFGDRELSCYGFYENTASIESHDEQVGDRLLKILQDFRPDVVHCFGTEYDHAEALVRVWDPEKVLVGIQGVCGAIAETYCADLPKKVINRRTFRDWLKKDSIRQQKEKFERRALREKRTLAGTAHVTGRTNLDKNYVLKINPAIVYHHMNETLRAEFYEGCWNRESCEEHSIFFSQADYPTKGFHYVLHAMPEILKAYPDTKVYVAGNSIVNWNTIKDKIKISSYGKYLRELIKRYHLENKVFFVGKLSAAEMKERMLNSHLFLCSSAMENSPNSLGEAMLLGVPCVAADVGGVPDLFRDGQDGILYQGHRPKGQQNGTEREEEQLMQAERIAAAVKEMWADEVRLQQFCENARAHGRATHDGNTNVKRLLEIYGQLADEVKE